MNLELVATIYCVSNLIYIAFAFARDIYMVNQRKHYEHEIEILRGNWKSARQDSEAMQDLMTEYRYKYFKLKAESEKK